MSELHTEEHRMIMHQLDCSKEVAEVKMGLVLANERIKEMKEDKDKGAVLIRWVGGMAFAIVMTVAGSAIGQSSTVKVLQEKVKEQKDEINKLNIYIQDVEASLEYKISEL